MVLLPCWAGASCDLDSGCSVRPPDRRWNRNARPTTCVPIVAQIRTAILPPRRPAFYDFGAIFSRPLARWLERLTRTNDPVIAHVGQADVLGVDEATVRRDKDSANAEPPPEPETPPLPVGEFKCIVIDPPWPIEKIEREKRIAGYSS